MPGALFYAMMCRADLVPTEAPVRVDEEHVLRAGRLGSRPTRECSEWSVLTTPRFPHGVTVLGPQTVEQRTSSVLASLGKQLTSPPSPHPPHRHIQQAARELCPGHQALILSYVLSFSEKHADLFWPTPLRGWSTKTVGCRITSATRPLAQLQRGNFSPLITLVASRHYH